MNDYVKNLLEEFETLKLSNKDFEVYKRLNRITEELIKLNSRQVSDYFIDYLKKKKYLLHNTLDIRLTHIFKIFEHYRDADCLEELIKLSEENQASSYLEDICNTIGKFKIEKSRSFLKKHLKNKRIGYRCAIELAYFPDATGERILMDSFKQCLQQKNFFDELFFALVNLRNQHVWKLTENYVRSSITQKERYKICVTFLKVKDSQTIPLLIDYYYYYKNNPQINSNDVKSIFLNNSSLLLKRVYKESETFTERILKKIQKKLQSYHFDYRVKSLFSEINIKPIRIKNE